MPSEVTIAAQYLIMLMKPPKDITGMGFLLKGAFLTKLLIAPEKMTAETS
jgi:hypothetical protein